jgi:acetoin utilization protein AcuB
MKLSADLMSDMIPALKITDTGGKALALMEVFKVSHLPVVDNKKFVGLISESDILDMNNPEVLVGNYTLDYGSSFIEENVPIFDVLAMVSSLNLSVIPVVNAEKEYVGAISVSELVVKFTENSSFEHQGGIIVIRMGLSDYSLAHVAQMVESNEAKILFSYLTNIPDTYMVELTIKVNTTDITSILQTLSRYSYNVVGVYNANNDMDQLLDDRYDQLMKFLNL